MNQQETMSSAASPRSRRIGLLLMVVVAVTASALPALAAGKFVTHNTPRYVASAKNLGTENPSKTMEVSLWLNPHNQAELDALAQQIYDRTSPNYRHFLTRSQLASRFAPTAAEAKTVRAFLEGKGLKIVRVGPNNFYVRARGTVGEIENAFHIQLNNYQVRGKTIRSNDRDPFIDGDAGALVRSVAGLDSGAYEHPAIARPTGPPNQKSGGPGFGSMAKATPSTSGDFFTTNCFTAAETETFSTNNDGEFPIATIKGTHLNLQSLTSAGCGYTPPPIQAAYGLSQLYTAGLDGTGQTIGIIDWCGSLTIQDDTNAFSAAFGLPLLTSSNFAITYTPSPSLCEATGQTEINIDVEWAHAVAPGANINLIVPPSASFTDVDEATFDAINFGLANVLSGSFGSPESFTSPTVIATENLISEIGALSGISTNYSSGDDGDYTFFGIPATVSAPADSPWATGVGGVTLALNSDNSIAWQSGWGNNEVLFSEAGFVADPPLSFGFIGGAGGGPSNCVTEDADFNCTGGFAKPSYQKKVAGKLRQVPDVGWLADPFTGVAILISVPGSVPLQQWQVWGGTSVACPMFSALWAIANQAAGEPLGLAAPYLYSMPAGAITDIVPVTAKNNVTASIQESPTSTTKYNANAVLGGSSAPKFVSAIWDFPSEQFTSLAISFDQDCSAEPPAEFFGTLCTDPARLHTKAGWDNVTGVGVPNALNFVNAFVPADAVKK
jgi:subtilase family serine protease